MKRVGSMVEVTPQRQPVADQNPYQCRVLGCRLPAGISDGSQPICGFHFGMPDAMQNATVRRIRANPLLLDALMVTEATSISAIRNLADQMIAAGMADLAPQAEVVLQHEGYGRHEEGLTVRRSEFEHPKLYRQRLQAALRTA